MTIKIEPLCDHIEYLEELVLLYHEEWRHLSSNDSIESRKATIIAGAGAQGIPSIYVAHNEYGLIGSAALVDKDMDTRPELGPWLAAVYVKEKYRNKGVASVLVNHCEMHAQKAGVETLYLFTEFASKLYLKHGWQLMEECDYRGVRVRLMNKQLTT